MSIGLGVALLVSTVVLVLIVWRVRPPASSDTVMTHLNVVVTPAEQLLTGDALGTEYGRPSRTAIALSPDGRLLAFSGRRGDQLHLYLRPFDKGDAIEVKGTEGAGSPFFSPDGAWIGFWADGKIKKVRADGGPIVDVCATSPTGGDQPARSDPSIERRDRRRLVGIGRHDRVRPPAGRPLAGRGARRRTRPAHDAWRRRDLPPAAARASRRARRALHRIRRAFYWDNVSTDVRVTATGERKQLVLKAVDARYLESGHLVYARDGVLFAQRFDATRFEVSGSPVGVLDNVMHAIRAGSSTRDTGAAQVAISRTGTLAYVRGGPYPAIKRRLVWVDAQGRESPVGAPARRVPRAASVARRQADRVHVAPFAGSRRVGRRAARRPELAHDFGGQNAFPIWTPDGSRLTISRSLGGPTNLFWIPLTGGQHEPEILAASAEQSRLPADWTPDGNTLVFVQDVLDKP